MNTAVPRVPAGTGDAGRRLWRAVLAHFDLDEHELVLLRQAVRSADICDELQAIVDAEGVLVDGRAHPAVVELRQQRITLARLLVALRVPVGLAEEDLNDGDSAPVGDLRRTQRRGLRGVYTSGGAR